MSVKKQYNRMVLPIPSGNLGLVVGQILGMSDVVDVRY